MTAEWHGNHFGATVELRIRDGGQTALVSYRNRVSEVNVPLPDELPRWEN